MIDGAKIADNILSELKRQKLPKKMLAAVLVGNDKASLSFLKQKAKAAATLGIKFKIIRLSASLTQKGLVRTVKAISNHPGVGGMIVQLPLPEKFDRIPVLNAIGIEKDVDVLNGETTSVLAPSVGALKRILSEIKFNPKGKTAVVVGTGMLIGKPVANWVMSHVARLTIFNKAGMDHSVLKQADLIVTGTGVPNLIKGADIKKNAVVIDYGYGKVDGKLTGDIHAASIAKVTPHFTPTPGGTGPIVVAQLLKNFFDLAG